MPKARKFPHINTKTRGYPCISVKFFAPAALLYFRSVKLTFCNLKKFWVPKIYTSEISTKVLIISVLIV